MHTAQKTRSLALFFRPATSTHAPRTLHARMLQARSTPSSRRTATRETRCSHWRRRAVATAQQAARRCCSAFSVSTRTLRRTRAATCATKISCTVATAHRRGVHMQCIARMQRACRARAARVQCARRVRAVSVLCTCSADGPGRAGAPAPPRARAAGQA